MARTGWIHALGASRRAQAAATCAAVVAVSLLTGLLAVDLIRQADPEQSVAGVLFAFFLHWSIVAIALWATLTVRARLVERIPTRSAGRVLLEIASAVAFVVLVVPPTDSMMTLVLGRPPVPDGVPIGLLERMLVLRTLGLYILALAGLALVRNDVERRRKDEELEQRALREEVLRAQLASARSDALRSQLHPHFLFNALHSIGGLVVEGESVRAHQALIDLGTLLRKTLQHGETRGVDVAEELRIIETFLALHALRMGDRLTSHVEATDEAASCGVPPLLLLPLVENAIQHGLAPRASGGRVDVTARVEGERLVLSVVDDGVGIRPAERSRSDDAGGGIGMVNCAERLRGLYGPDAEMRVDRPASGGTRVTLELPAVPVSKAHSPMEVDPCAS